MMKFLWLFGLTAALSGMGGTAAAQPTTSTPIQHLVVLFDENNSFDHYFGTYPNATNPPGEPRFDPAPGTPRVNGLNAGLLTNNPNSVAPFRLDRTQAALNCDNNNGYAAEQAAFDRGLMDRFPESTSAAASPQNASKAACPDGVAMEHLCRSQRFGDGKSRLRAGGLSFGSGGAALRGGTLPAVSFVKAPSTETGHPRTSDALSEQKYLVDTITALQQSNDWPTMAILIAYDDSDGWYDHVMPPIVVQSNDQTLDTICGGSELPEGAFNERCGYGSRLPFLVISPLAKQNYVDHAVLDTTSILRFIEDNWQLGRIDSLDYPDGTPDGNPPPGQGSFDRLAGSIDGLFDFGQTAKHDVEPLLLDDSTGEVMPSR